MRLIPAITLLVHKSCSSARGASWSRYRHAEGEYRNVSLVTTKSCSIAGLSAVPWPEVSLFQRRHSNNDWVLSFRAHYGAGPFRCRPPRPMTDVRLSDIEVEVDQPTSSEPRSPPPSLIWLCLALSDEMAASLRRHRI